jgi:serine/threonine protein kinase
MAFDRLSGSASETDCVDELLPGTPLLHGQYRIARFLNSGGFGITYIARDALNRDVVLKECFVEAFCTRNQTAVQPRSDHARPHLQRAIASFGEEARILAMMNHPNIVRIHQLFAENGTSYMALDYIAGHDLVEIVDEKKAILTPGQIVRIAERLISALSHIHDRQLIHCDVSPDNICVSPSGEPVLIDFGAARRMVDGVAQRHSGFSLVKDGYSPPELYQSSGVCGTPSDIYSLAASLYYVITGRAPVDGETRLRALIADRPDPLISLAGVIPGYPPGFLATIDKAMSVEPGERYATAKAWLRATATPPAAQAKPLRQQLFPAPLAQAPETRDRNVVLLRRATVVPTGESPEPDQSEPAPKAIYSGI